MAAKKAQKKPPKPYNPAAVTKYPSKKAFNTEINTRAQGLLKPTLNDISARRREELGAHETRTRDIQGYYDYDVAARQAAQTRMQEALTGILGTAGVANSDAQAGLSAALRPSADANSAAASQLGVQAPGVDPQVANVLASYGKGNQMSLAGDFGSQLGRSAADIALTGVERRDAGNKEMGVNRAALTALTKERTDANAQLPALKSQARTSMLQEILANSQNNLAWKQFGEGRTQARAQQNLARDQFGETVRSNRANEKLGTRQLGLAKSQFGESKRARRFDEKMARKEATLSRDQLKLARDELNAKVEEARTTQELGQAQDNAKRFDSATTYLQGYLAPGDQDMKYNSNGKKVFDPKRYKARVNDGKFHEVLVNLMTTYGLDRATAYQVMRSAPIFRKKAEKFADAWNMRNYGVEGRFGPK
jgi:hypothetical protein